jgi:hypothetical protein|tara:strand:- start:11650 stop:12354 length:705 start_codon:yes stop_codon:yes gene_type:complete
MGHPWVVDIKGLAEKYNLKYFVETGTLTGDTVEYVSSLGCFDKIFSVEIEPEIYAFAKDRFVDNDNVEILLGNSYEVLENDILPQLDGPTFFWLDAHFPGADINLNGKTYTSEEHMDTNCPLRKEIDVIKKSPYHLCDFDSIKRRPQQNVILIDDAWLYTKQEVDGLGGNAKTADQHWKNIGQPEATVAKLMGDDVSDEFIYSSFPNHQVGFITRNCGYFLITPFADVINPMYP